MNTATAHDRRLVLKILNLRSVSTVQYVDTGWTSRVYLVDDGAFVVKFPRSDETKKEYAQEISLLKLLNSVDIEVQVPRIIAVGDNYNYLAYKGIVGNALTMLSGQLDTDQGKAIGGSLGNFLKQLHPLHLDDAPVMTIEAEIAQFQQKYEQGRYALDNALSEAEKSKLHLLVYEFLPERLLKLGYDPALCHGDLGYWNIIMSPYQTIGIIDFGDVGYWDRSKDFIGFEDQAVLNDALLAYASSALLVEKVTQRKKILPLLDLQYYADTEDEQNTRETIAKIKTLLTENRLN